MPDAVLADYPDLQSKPERKESREKEVQGQEAVAAPSQQEAEAKKSLASRIRSKKVKDPNLYDATLGIPITVWNGLVELTANLVEAGMAIRDAVAKVIGDYKAKNPQSKIDDVRVAAELTRQVTPIERVPGERTVAKRFLGSPDLSPETKEQITNKLYKVLHEKEANAVIDEIMRTVPSVESAITLYRDVYRAIPDWVRVMLGGRIVSALSGPRACRREGRRQGFGAAVAEAAGGFRERVRHDRDGPWARRAMRSSGSTR